MFVGGHGKLLKSPNKPKPTNRNTHTKHNPSSNLWVYHNHRQQLNIDHGISDYSLQRPLFTTPWSFFYVYIIYYVNHICFYGLTIICIHPWYFICLYMYILYGLSMVYNNVMYYIMTASNVLTHVGWSENYES